MSNNILQYESTVWATADLLIGSGIKQSDFPGYMMPFFALIIVESRLIRSCKRFGKRNRQEDIDDFIEEFKDRGLGYNDYVIRQNKTLKDICQIDKAFNLDFHSYHKAFDNETKNLLGVDVGTEDIKYLNISGISGLLSKKKILFETVKAWSEIDLIPFSNSEITTLEEHIKRKWADISAETAGEQYTPDDIISLISEIITSKIEDNGKFLNIFDPTCGGGNLLFGVEDKIKDKFQNRPTATFGQDWSDSLFALAKIESRFRKDSNIEYGNSLVDIKFIHKKIDIVVANPPYVVDWKGYKKDIDNDQTERFHALPSISDGKFLFTQHILYHLENSGLSASLKDYYENYFKTFIAQQDYKEQNLKVYTKTDVYWFDSELERIVNSKTINNQSKIINHLGCGKIIIKAAYKIATKTKDACIEINTELTPDYQKDYEIIPYSPNPEENKNWIDAFMTKYITKPFEYLDNVVGVEINFNKVYYKRLNNLLFKLRIHLIISTFKTFNLAKRSHSLSRFFIGKR